MELGRAWRTALALGIGLSALLPACSRRKPAEINPIEPQVSFSRSKVPLDSAVEITYTWKLDPSAKKLGQDYRAMVHFLDSHKVVLMDDDHVPVPPPAQWEPGQTYSYKRSKFIPIFPYVGPVEVRMGLYAASGRGERVALKGEDAGMNEIKVAAIDFNPQTDNIFLVEKDGWYGPETSPSNPAAERMWTKKEAGVSFKNPKQDVVLYLEADTNYKAFPQPPVLTLSVGGGAYGLVVPIDSSEVFLKKVRFKAEQLGDGEWVELRLAMNQSFVPRSLGMTSDERELGIMVYGLFVGEADKLGQVEGVVDAAPLAPATAAGAKPAAGKPAPKPTPAAARKR